MKKNILAAFIFVCGAAGLSAQAIPPYAGNQMPESIPTVQEKKLDLPGKAGSYVAEGGFHFYYTKGKYYKEQTEPDGDTVVDSKGKKYTPWGLTVNPSAEFFLFDMFALGGTAKFDYEKQGSDKLLSLGVGPVISFYYNKLFPIIPYVSIFGLYSHSNFYEASTKSMYWTDQNLSGGARLGAVFMMSRQGGVFVEGRFTYGKHQVTIPPATNQTKQTGWIAETYFGFKYFMF
jgi:hypothetical protein